MARRSARPPTSSRRRGTRSAASTTPRCAELDRRRGGRRVPRRRRARDRGARRATTCTPAPRWRRTSCFLTVDDDDLGEVRVIRGYSRLGRRARRATRGDARRRARHRRGAHEPERLTAARHERRRGGRSPRGDGCVLLPRRVGQPSEHRVRDERRVELRVGAAERRERLRAGARRPRRWRSGARTPVRARRCRRSRCTAQCRRRDVVVGSATSTPSTQRRTCCPRACAAFAIWCSR